MATINILGVPCVYDLTAPTSSSLVLVFVHGWLLSRGYWQPLVDRLSPTYQCLAYDLRGFGGSQLYPRSDLPSSYPDTFSLASLPYSAISPSSHPLPSGASPQVQQTPETASNPENVYARDSSSQSHTLQDLKQQANPDALAHLSFESSLAQPITPRQASHQMVSLPAPETITADQTFQASYTPSAYARDLAVLLQSLNLTNVWLVGHSLGGTIALWAAHQLPNVVQGVICLNSGGGIYLKEDFERFRAAGQQILKLRPRWLCHLPMIDLIFDRSTIVHPIDRIWRRKRLIDFVTAHPEAALGSLMDSTTEAEVNCLPLLVSDLKQPVYFLAGLQDPVMQINYVRHLASFHFLFGTCGDNVIELDDCGHMAMLEQTERVTVEIQAILQRANLLT